MKNYTQLITYVISLHNCQCEISFKHFFLTWWWVYITIHYNKPWVFKKFNMTKMSTLTKRKFALTKGTRHERHMVILISFFLLK
jgi:hypothetical protein